MSTCETIGAIGVGVAITVLCTISVVLLVFAMPFVVLGRLCSGGVK